MPNCADCLKLHASFSANKIWMWSDVPWGDKKQGYRRADATGHMFYKESDRPLCKMWWETERVL